MSKFFACLLVSVLLFSINAMAESKLEIDQSGELRIAKKTNVWKDTDVTVSDDAKQYPPELIFSAVNAKGEVIPVKTTIRQIPEGFNLRTEEIASVGLSLKGNHVVVVHDQLVSVEMEVNPFYHLILVSGSMMLLVVVLRYLAASVASVAAVAAVATVAAVVAFVAALAAAALAVVAALAAAAAAAAVAAFVTFVVDDKKFDWWLIAWSFCLLIVSTVFMYFGI